MFVFGARNVSLRAPDSDRAGVGGGGVGKEEWGEFVACGEAILISMSRDRPVLSGVEGGGGKTECVAVEGGRK